MTTHQRQSRTAEKDHRLKQNPAYEVMKPAYPWILSHIGYGICVAPKITSNRAEASRRYYEKNKDKILQARKDNLDSKRKGTALRRQRYQARINELKAVPCTDCGVPYPYYVMDFDHVRGKKVAGVAQMMSQGRSLEAIEEEIAKCEVVCANCHRKRTYQRR